MAEADAAITKLILGVENWAKEVREDAFDAMLDTELEGASAMHERIMNAVTAWGSARQAGLVAGPKGSPPARPHAGRLETEEMYDKVTSETNWVGKDTIEARWGWQDQDLKDYFLAQEHGTDRIAPMESIAISLFEAEDYLKGRLDRVGR